MFLSCYHISFEDFYPIYIDQMSEVRNQIVEIISDEIYFFSINLIDKTKINSNPRQVVHEMHRLCNDCFLTLVNGSDFYNTIFSRFKVLQIQNRVFDRGKNQFSFLGGLGPPNSTLHHAMHGCMVYSSRDS